MNRWNLTKRAKESLIDIYNYTLTNWGEKQADNYLDRLYNKFRQIADNPNMWRPIPRQFEVEGYFARYERHYIYWCQNHKKEIIFTDIIHDSMMQSERLKKAFELPERD